MKQLTALFALALAACATPPAGGPQREAIVPPGEEQARDVYHYSPAVRAGDFVFFAGVVGGRRRGEETDEAAFDRAFRHLRDVLTAAGVDFSDIVEMTTYHTDLPAQFQLFSQVKDRYMSAPYPAWTAIDVDRLLPDSGIVEIRVTVYDPRD